MPLSPDATTVVISALVTALGAVCTTLGVIIKLVLEDNAARLKEAAVERGTTLAGISTTLITMNSTIADVARVVTEVAKLVTQMHLWDEWTRQGKGGPPP